MTMNSLQTMLTFLNFLSDKNIESTICQQQPEAVMVSFAMVGHRVEVEFFLDRVEYSVFKGDEGVETGLEQLVALVEATI
jgi:hypothetical protein